MVKKLPVMQETQGAGNGYPLQYSCLENPMDRGAWRATVGGVTESDMTEGYTHTHTHTHRIVGNVCKAPGTASAQ